MEFFVNGIPIAKQSFRVVKDRLGRSRGGYLKPALKAWQELIYYEAKQATEGKAPYPGRVAVILEFYLQRDSADLDNLTKAVLDSIQKVVYTNDRHVDRLSVEKIIDRNKPPGVYVEVIPISLAT